jgi:nucleotide-binding universal stress UspA family protein
VADVWLPHGVDPEATQTGELAPVSQARDRARQALDEARTIAAEGGARVQGGFPGWTVEFGATADSPAWAIIKKAEAWRADCVVLGSRGRSAVDRLLLGSVSEKVLLEAPSSVRIVRKTMGAGNTSKLLLGLDGSPDASRAADEVARRHWPSGSEVRIVTAVDAKLRAAPAKPGLPLAQWLRGRDPDETSWVGTMHEAIGEQLRHAGLAVTSVVDETDPRTLLVEEAERWKPDCVFIGARGLRRFARILHGSVSSYVAIHAPCTVEVVRDRTAEGDES